jgi:hypothetical protein
MSEQEKPKLSEMLVIKDGEITSIVEDIPSELAKLRKLPNKPMTYVDYEAWCKLKEQTPCLDEWLLINGYDPLESEAW